MAFVPPHQRENLFYILATIITTMYESTGSVLFCRSFYNMYIKSTGRFSNDFYNDTEQYKHLTNNFAEGKNSALKKFISGRQSECAIAEWLAIDARRESFNLGKNYKPSKLTTGYFFSFQDALIKKKYTAAIEAISQKLE